MRIHFAHPPADRLRGTYRPRRFALAGIAVLTAAIACEPAADAPADPGATGFGPASDPEPARQAVPAPTVTIDTSNTHARWSAAIPPVARAPSGTVIEAFTKEASDGQVTRATTIEDLGSVDFGRIHPLTGPLYVEGADPGDVLAVTLHDIEVLDWGWAVILPGFGFLSDEFDRPFVKGFELEPGDEHATFNDRIRIPLRPFAGVMGVAPATDSMLVTIPPRANGGNMDNRHMVAGTTVYFPVQVEGALFSLGDTHAAQGDGEVSGTAIEAPMRIVYEVEVIKGGRSFEEPQYETEDYYATTGFATTIDEAARKATRYMIDYLVAEHGLTQDEAYVLCSLAGDLKISETVDVPHMLVSMHMPKSVLGID